VYWCEEPGVALERVAVLIALAGVPVLATGVLVHSSSMPLPPPMPEGTAEAGMGGGKGEGMEGEGGLSAALRTVRTALALAGILVLLAALAMAWPQPVALILVCAVNFSVLSIVAWRCQWAIAHAGALPCLAVGYLTAYHLLSSGLDAARVEL